MAKVTDRWHQVVTDDEGHRVNVRSKAYGQGNRWQVRYRDPHRQQKARNFKIKADAELFRASVTTDKQRGEYIDPKAGQVTFEVWAQEWMQTTTHLKPKSVEGYRSLLHAHLVPAFGHMGLSAIRPIDVRGFISELSRRGLSPSRQRQARHLLGTILGAAVENGIIARNPVVGVKVPREPRREMQPLTAAQVQAVAEHVPTRYRALIYLLAYGGLRWGEATALRRGRINFRRQRVEVVESCSEIGSGIVWGDTKTHERRDVVVPKFLVKMLSDHLARYAGVSNDALVFSTPSGTPLLGSNFRLRVWQPALEAAGLPAKTRLHDLRHTSASLLIAQGAHVKQILLHLGHSSSAITLDTYTHLLPDGQDKIADALDASFHGGE